MQEEKQTPDAISPKTCVKKCVKERLYSDAGAIGNIRVLCFAAMLAAMSLIVGKFLQIPNPFQNIIRISFENLPILLSGITMGPFVGALTGIVADLLGCILYGYSINPIITLGAGAVGLISGVMANYVIRRPLVARVICAAVASHLLGSVIIKSLGLAAWFLTSYDMGLLELMLWRLLTYAVIATAECVILCLLLRHRAVSTLLERIRKK